MARKCEWSGAHPNEVMKDSLTQTWTNASASNNGPKLTGAIRHINLYAEPSPHRASNLVILATWLEEEFKFHHTQIKWDRDSNNPKEE
ncbi:hypothetical protein Clacol_000418 [Clathrus columnatus]|uniref:Uncharacterized protein n=1 Tax=Clathrus columnatus TaxID=1419009 RepID=A0AAV4ZYI1_9AGAM|nr:hypothetical protein Clacol_000418 [Clathrus columnatus]